MLHPLCPLRLAPLTALCCRIRCRPVCCISPGSRHSSTNGTSRVSNRCCHRCRGSFKGHQSILQQAAVLIQCGAAQEGGHMAGFGSQGSRVGCQCLCMEQGPATAALIVDLLRLRPGCWLATRTASLQCPACCYCLHCNHTSRRSCHHSSSSSGNHNSAAVPGKLMCLAGHCHSSCSGHSLRTWALLSMVARQPPFRQRAST
jgi:hypothetical protein